MGNDFGDGGIKISPTCPPNIFACLFVVLARYVLNSFFFYSISFGMLALIHTQIPLFSLTFLDLSI